MPVMNIIEAVRNALQLQMRADSRVVVLGPLCKVAFIAGQSSSGKNTGKMWRSLSDSMNCSPSA